MAVIVVGAGVLTASSLPPGASLAVADLFDH
jgi:hypothetical protein